MWSGDTKNKGVAIFAKPNVNLKRLNWCNIYKDHKVKHFLPITINEEFQLLNVWTHRNNSPNFGYIGQFWKYLQVNKEKFNKIIIAGDFNSNVIWDQWDRWWNRSDVLKELREIGIESLYHKFANEEQGKESKPTFFLQRNLNKAYHIDYFFGSRYFLDRLSDIMVENNENWKLLSDHLPITVVIDI